MSQTPIILSIAGSDNSGGAGIQADIKTCSLHNAYTCTAITAVTSQNNTGLKKADYVGADMLSSQLDSIFAMFTPGAIKIGMLPCAEAANIVTAKLKEYKGRNIILDPVIGATSGGSLSGDTYETVCAIAQNLFPLCRCITPNIPEALYLYHIIENKCCTPNEASSIELTTHEIERLAIYLLNRYRLNGILIKGGHNSNNDNVTDIAAERIGENVITHIYENKRIDTNHTHGTGCALSSAIACRLAQGYELKEAIELAGKFVNNAIKEADRHSLVKSNGPIYLI